MNLNLPVIAGSIATTLFALSTLPMVWKAYRTKDLESYSLGYLLLGNAGNLFYSIYVYNLPPGPIWVLHTFYLVVTGLMLFWYLRYEWWPGMKRKLRAWRAKRASGAPARRSWPIPAATELPQRDTPFGA